MEKLETKEINGHTYYYYSKWEWSNGRCRRVWQKYLGKLEDIVAAVQHGGAAPVAAEVFQWGLPEALWRECQRAQVREQVNARCPKREQGLDTGAYIALAAVNRAMAPCSKRSFWEWFGRTTLRRHLPEASREALASQRFWDHMDRIRADQATAIWKEVLAGALRREALDIGQVCYDGTNFYTFIDTFNTRCEAPRHGKNKQGRANLRQVSYALFCSADGHVPLFYDCYPGNRVDMTEFPLILRRFHAFLGELSAKPGAAPEVTLVFDKGNTCEDNMHVLDALQGEGPPVHFVTSVKLEEHKELARLSTRDAAFVPCGSPGLEDVKALRVTKMVYGQPRTLVLTYNQTLANAQWLTVQQDMAHAMERLEALRQKLDDRVRGAVTRGKTPTLDSVRGQCKDILHRQHLNQLIAVQTTLGADGIPRLEFAVDTAELDTLSDTWLGKTLLMSDRDAWDNDRIILAYRSQFIIEDVFKEMKDRTLGSWWPLHHWTDSKIAVHVLYCTIALLLRALMMRRLKNAGMALSMKRVLTELNTICEVVNIYPKKRGRSRTPAPQTTVLTTLSETQQRIIALLALNTPLNPGEEQR